MAEIVGYECKHIVYMPSNNSPDDALFVKENIHFDDGTYQPNFRRVENYKRDVYIVKPGLRNYREKKIAEPLHRLQKYTCTQRKLPEQIVKALGMFGGRDMPLKRLCRSPYVYGADVTSATLLKHQYKTKYPTLVSPNSLGVLDIETSVEVDDNNKTIIAISFTYKENAILVATKKFLEGAVCIEDRVRCLIEKYIGDDIKARNITVDFQVLDTPGQAVKYTMEAAHRLQPDWIACWNINFDLPRLIDAVLDEGMDPNDVFCDPRVPKHFRNARYIEGQANKVTASGKFQPLAPHERWHRFDVPSSFYWIDAMVVYAMIRKAKGNESSYKLDDVLAKNINREKLKFSEADGKYGHEWHYFMQTTYKPEYLSYNLFDSISVELLDEKTNDLRLTLPELVDFGEVHTFKSTPKQLADDLHFFCLEKGLVVASTSDQMLDELDEHVIGRDGWIITLPAHQMVEEGYCLFEDFPEIPSLCYIAVADLDVKSSYPYTEIFANVCRSTTIMEICEIKGVTEEQRRIAGLNLTGGITNAVEFCTVMYKLPEFDPLLEAYEEFLKEAA